MEVIISGRTNKDRAREHANKTLAMNKVGDRELRGGKGKAGGCGKKGDLEN